MSAVLFDGLWQGAIIVALAALVTRYFARESAATRYAVWMLSLVAIVVMPVLSIYVPIHVPVLDHTISSGASGRIRFTLVAAGAIADRSWVVGWLLGVWGFGVAVMVLRLVVSAVRIEAIRRRAVPVIIERSTVLASDDIAAPIAAGVISPVIIVPRALLQNLERDDLRRVLAHERAHIARNDIAATYLQRIFEALLFFNPWVFAIGRRLVNEREAACDDMAVAATGESHAYAVCLASLAAAIAGRRDPLVSPSVFGSRRALIGRIERLVADDAHRTMKLNYGTIGATLLLFIVAAVSLQPFAPALASGGGIAASPVSVAAACSTPDRDVAILRAAPPDFPDGATPKRPVLLNVTIGRSGIPTNIAIKQSSGDWRADAAAAQAAQHSTYRPAIKHCHLVQGTYVFRAEFAPIS